MNISSTTIPRSRMGRLDETGIFIKKVTIFPFFFFCMNRLVQERVRRSCRRERTEDEGKTEGLFEVEVGHQCPRSDLQTREELQIVRDDEEDNGGSARKARVELHVPWFEELVYSREELRRRFRGYHDVEECGEEGAPEVR